MRALFIAIPMLALAACESTPENAERCETVQAAIVAAEVGGFTKIELGDAVFTIEQAKALAAVICPAPAP